MIDLNITLFIQFINFIIALIGLNYILIKPVQKSIYQRQETFFLAKKEIESLTTQTNTECIQYESMILKAKEEAHVFYEKEQSTIEKIKDTLLTTSYNDAQQQIIQTKIAMNAESIKVQQELEDTITDFSNAVLTTLLNDNV